MYKMGLPVLTEEFVLMNDITVRRAQVLCAEGRIEGAFRLGRAWIIPRDAEKPADARIKSGKYVKVKDGGANED
jgi:hypothetical protein